jgi:hypothetical protein
MTRVISEVNFADSSINIAPVITNISIDRNGDQLTVEADAVDDQNSSDLTYAWSFTNKSFINATTNPATLTAFEDGTTGTLNVVVTDSEGAETNASYAVASNQFPDITAPSITSITPNDNASDVAVDSVITIEFNEAVQSSSITSNSVIVSDGINAVAGTLNSTGSTVTFTPTNELNYEANYIVTVTADVKDVSGNNLAYQGGSVTEFTTAPAIPIDNLLAFYTFDNIIGTTVIDEKGENNGTLFGSPTLSSEYKIGDGSLYFNSIEDKMITPILQASSISFWINMDSNNNTAVPMIWKDGNGFSQFFAIGSTITGSLPNEKMGIGSQYTSLDVISGWTHIVLNTSSAAGHTDLYINGSLFTDWNLRNQATTSTIETYLSVSNNPNVSDGSKMDQMRVYGRNLAQEEILVLSNEQ